MKSSLDIRKARPDEFESVRAFYHRLIDEMENAEFGPGWEKGIYPSDTSLQEMLAGGELSVGILDGDIVAAMAVNHRCNDSYAHARWQVSAQLQQAAVIHILGVLPSHSGKGLGKQLVQRALEDARREGLRAVRLDVLKGNLPAERLYTRMGFQYVETLPMFYEDTGWTDFLLYEYPL